MATRASSAVRLLRVDIVGVFHLLTMLSTSLIYIFVSRSRPWRRDLKDHDPSNSFGGLVKEASMIAFQFDVPKAGRALRALLRDPDDLPQVFTLIESLSGTAPYRLLSGFERSKSGKRLLQEKPDILPILADR